VPGPTASWDALSTPGSSADELRAAIKPWLEHYNTLRPHQAR